MILLHKESYECVVSDLDLTATPPPQTSVEDEFLSSRYIFDRKKITPWIATHALRAIFEVLLNLNKNAKSTHLETSGFKKDTEGEMDSLEKNSSYDCKTY